MSYYSMLYMKSTCFFEMAEREHKMCWNFHGKIELDEVIGGCYGMTDFILTRSIQKLGSLGMVQVK